MRLRICYLLFTALVFAVTAEGQTKNPLFEEVLSLRSPGTPIISPDGRHIAFNVGSTDWENNRYDSEIWLSKDGGTPFQLTNTADGSSGNIQWSPDSKYIGFSANRGDKNQIHIISVNGGEAVTITNEKEGISGFQWAPDMKSIIYTRSVKNEDRKKTEEKYGKFGVEDDEYSLVELMSMPFNIEFLHQPVLPEYTRDSVETEKSKPKPLIEKPDFYIAGFRMSPDGQYIIFNRRPNPLRISSFESDIYLFDLSNQSSKVLVANKSSDGFLSWSPDSKSILYRSDVDNRTSNYYENNRIFKIDINGTINQELATDFDENISGITWNPSGIFGTAYQKTKRRVVRIDPNSGKTMLLSTVPDRIYGFTFDKAGSKIAFNGDEDDSLREVYVSQPNMTISNKLTNFSDQIKDWKTAKSEVISWKSKDGATIEGVLHKPMDYDPQKKYPLMVVIHGGPTGIDRPSPVLSYVYPVNQWLNKGALVLRPNYRGSAGYGADFRKLNVRNLGVGDAWDVLSGVEHLEKQGLIDTDKMGAMGWSQGGYISAFLTTNTDRFKAISVGAGISDWMTYYVNTDIHPFTRQYLKANPWEDPEIYAKTSPMTNINNAKTPTLIQHGEFDKRVPTPNAYQLYQGLQDVGVDTKLIVYKGFGHGITKPKERLAAVQHNWDWFLKYVWGEEQE